MLKVYINKEACELIARLKGLSPPEAAVLYALAHEVGPTWRSWRFGYADLSKATKFKRDALISAVNKLVAKNLIRVERSGMTKAGQARETNTYHFTQNFIDQSATATSGSDRLVAQTDMTSGSDRLKESRITDKKQKIPPSLIQDAGVVNGKRNAGEIPRTIEEAKAMADRALKKKWGR